MCTFGLSGCRVKPQPNVHISGSRRFKHHQNSTKRPPREREERKKTVAGEGKKARNFGPPTLRAHHSGLHSSGLHSSGPHRKIGRSRNWPNSKKKSWPKSNLAEVDRAPCPGHPRAPDTAVPRTPLRGTAQNFALFSLSHLHFRSFFSLSLGIFSCLFFLSLGVFSWNFPPFGSSTLRSPGPPHPSGHHISGLHPFSWFGSHPWGPHLFGASPFGPPPFDFPPSLFSPPLWAPAPIFGPTTTLRAPTHAPSPSSSSPPQPRKCQRLTVAKVGRGPDDCSLAPSNLSAQVVPYRETTHRGSAIAEARRSSASSCLSRSVRSRSRMGQFGSGLSSRGSPGALAASSEEVADRWSHRRALHSDVWAVVCPERYSPTRSSRSGVLLLQKPHRLHRWDVIVPQTAQAARSSWRSCATLSGSSCCPPCF